MDYRTLMMSLGPAFYWRLGESSGGAIVDEVIGQSVTLYGTPPTYNAPSMLTGDSNGSMTFASSYAITPNHSKYCLGGGDFSFSIIAKTTTSSFSCAFVIRVDNDTVMLLMSTSRAVAGDFSLETWSWADTTTRPGTIPMNDGKPHHIVGTYDNNTRLLSLYADGKLAAAKTQNVGRPVSTWAPQLSIGNNIGAAQYFPGSLDEFALFSRLLTGEEAYRLYSVFANGPLARQQRVSRRSRRII
jgi:hypothetical protein